MEENKQQNTEDQSKEAKKVEAKFEGALRKLTAIMGPDWTKSTKIGREDLPAVMQKIIEKKKEELFERFQQGYVGLVEKKKNMDKTIADRKKEFDKIVLAEKKAFLAEAENLMKFVDEIDQIERDYYNTIIGAGHIGEQREETEPQGEEQANQ